jgi:hypothetical protein
MPGQPDGRSLPHGYTNAVTAQGDLVTKIYRGPGAAERQQREELAIRSVADRLPVATIVDAQPGVLVLRKIPGRHGQERIDRGEGDAVMFGLGRLLRDVQAISPVFFGELGELGGAGVLVHHDFGPNNVLFAEGDDSVVLLADWEWSTVGHPITDLAWAELILRMHHPEHLACLPALFDGYGARPPWTERQAAMARRASALETWVRSYKGERAASTWDRRSRRIRQWQEIT